MKLIVLIILVIGELMINRNEYFYKGYDIDSNSRKEKKEMELCNPYGYNFESNRKREVDPLKEPKTNQDNIYPFRIKEK